MKDQKLMAILIIGGIKIEVLESWLVRWGVGKLAAVEWAADQLMPVSHLELKFKITLII